MVSDRELRGPVKYLAEHPAARAVSLSGAGTAAGIFATRALKSRGAARFGWAMLFALQVGILVGILAVPSAQQRPLARDGRRSGSRCG